MHHVQYGAAALAGQGGILPRAASEDRRLRECGLLACSEGRKPQVQYWEMEGL